MTTSGRSLNTLAVAAIVIVTGSGPQSKRDDAALGDGGDDRRDVQLAGVPLPTTRSGVDVSTSPALGRDRGASAGVAGRRRRRRDAGARR